MTNPKVEVLPIEQGATPDLQNINKHTQRGRGLHENSMRNRGAGRSIFSAGKGADVPVVMGGNQTLEIAATLGMEVINVHTTGNQIVNVVRDDIAPGSPEFYAMGIEDNEIGKQSYNPDIDILAAVMADPAMQALKDEDKMLAGIVEGMGLKTAKPVDAEPQIDRAAELAEKWQTKSGQLWRLGDHRLLIGDCTELTKVSRLLSGVMVNLVHADPPYGMGKNEIENDNLYKDKLDLFQMQWFERCVSFITDNASVYIWGTAEDLWRLWFSSLSKSRRVTIRNEIVWDKGSGQGMGSDAHRMYPTASERCLFFVLGEQGYNNNADNYWDGFEPIRAYLDGERVKMGWSNKVIADWFGFHPRMADHWFSQSQWSMPIKEQYQELQKRANGGAFKKDYDELKKDYDELKKDFYATRAPFNNTHELMTDVWQFDTMRGEDRPDHPTPKPVKMMERIFKTSGTDDAVIYSPFLGSGTDIIAGQNSGRTVYGLEKDEKYGAVILERFFTATGITPELVE